MWFTLLMTADAPPRPLTVSTEVAASPAQVWAVVADVRRTGEWSPECVAVTPLGPVRRGTFMLGRNRRGRVHWATLSRIDVYEPGTAIGWTVLTNRSRWRYDLRPVVGGTAVVQTRRTPRGEARFALWFTRRFLDGQARHDDELEGGMAAGLERIRAIVAGSSSPSGTARSTRT